MVGRLAVGRRRGGRGVWGDPRTDEPAVLVELLYGKRIRVGAGVGNKPTPRLGRFLTRVEVARELVGVAGADQHVHRS